MTTDPKRPSSGRSSHLSQRTSRKEKGPTALARLVAANAPNGFNRSPAEAASGTQDKAPTKTKMHTKTVHERRLLAQMIFLSTLITISSLSSAADDFFPASARPARLGPESGADSRGGPPNRTSGFVWQPLPLRATFRPLNRQSQPSQPPRAIPRPPSPPEPAALISERSISDPASSDNLFGRFGGPAPFADDSPNPTARGANNADPTTSTSNFFQPPPPPALTTTPTPVERSNFVGTSDDSTTAQPIIELDDDLPTRQPMNRFRPTRAPSDDSDSSQQPPAAAAAGGPQFPSPRANTSDRSPNRMSSECFECICEASTNCNANSRCQTSDVRHTRCGMFLISYDQWLATGLSRELVSREALARDAAADERAFYDCVTKRDCSERLLSIFMSRNQKDCDRDGRVDCYDYAAIHHGGMDQCASETLLDSQYWNDFNACLGFGR